LPTATAVAAADAVGAGWAFVSSDSFVEQVLSMSGDVFLRDFLRCRVAAHLTFYEERLVRWTSGQSRLTKEPSLGERCAGPTQPRDRPQILAIRYVLEMMVGRAVEFSKHQCLSPADLWCTRSRKLVREYRQRRNDRDRGWPHQIRPPEPPRWLVQMSVRQKRDRSIGRPYATGALLEKCFGNLLRDPFCRRLRYCHWPRAQCEWKGCETGISWQA